MKRTRRIQAIGRWISLGAITWAAAGLPGYSADTRPVTQDQFKELVRVLRNMIDRENQINAKVTRLAETAASLPPAAAPGADTSQTVDLNAMAATPAAPPAAASPHNPHASGTPSLLQIYFDLMFYYRPGITTAGAFSFDNYHSFLLVEANPSPMIEFNVAFNPTPQYYELTLKPLPWLHIKAGKIWIPFDDINPHNIYGGRINVNRLLPPGATGQFLPNLFTDLGVDLHFIPVDTRALNLTVDGYVINGFHAGGTDPLGGTNAYPDFANLSTIGGSADNNSDKTFGGRVHALFFNKIGVGASLLTGRWNDEIETTAQRVLMYGVDGSVRIGPFESRGGWAGMNVGVESAPGSFTRGGFYGEAGFRFGSREQFKVLGRGGLVQLDNRAYAVTDTTLVGGIAYWRLGPLLFSVEYSHDLNSNPGGVVTKTALDYAAGRLAMTF